MKKLKLYLDTSVLSFAIATDVPAERQITLKLFEEVNQGKHEVFISDVVIKEINRAPEPILTSLKALISELNAVVLLSNEDAQSLAKKYVEHDIIPNKHGDDALHIAVASVNDLDVIVSWNFSHIVKVKTKKEVTGINLLMGYKEIEIYSPKEVIENAD